MGSSLGRLAAAGARAFTKADEIAQQDRERALAERRAALAEQAAARQAALEERRAALAEREASRRASIEAAKAQAAPAWRPTTRDEAEAFERFKAGLQPKREPQAPSSYSFPVGADDEGRPVIMRANTRTGEVAPTGQAARPAGGLGSGAVERQKRARTLANLTDALNTFETTLGSTGSRLLPGRDKSVLQSAYTNLALQLKEFMNLGVLNGPDLMLIRQLQSDPTSLVGRAEAGGSGAEQQRRALAQAKVIRGILERAKHNLEAEGPDAGSGGGSRGGDMEAELAEIAEAQKTDRDGMTANRERYDALRQTVMAKYQGGRR